MSDNEFDIIIIGAGPGGYVAAIRAAQLGMKTACIEKNTTLGGTCLNVGCIPSKALLQSSHKYHEALHELAEHGIITKPKLDLSAMMARKDKVVDDLTKGIAFLFKKNKITHIKGTAEFTDAHNLAITDGADKGKTLTAKHIIIASGSTSAELPHLPIDEKRIVSSTGALSFAKVPEHLVVIGAGVIGLELGSVWARLGAKVTVVEYLERICPSLDAEVAKQLQNILKKQGLEFILGHGCDDMEKIKSNYRLHLTASKDGAKQTLDCDHILVSIGRKPNTQGLKLDQIGVACNERGFIITDEYGKTNIAGVYAIGDATTGAMLAHKAEDEGIVCVERINNIAAHLDYNIIPSVVYTEPEVADVGKNEEQLKAENIAYKVGKFPFTANSRARAMGINQGFVKILACAQSDRILGGHIVGAEAGNMIHEIATIMEFGGSSEDLARCCHAHPTLNEAVREAALALGDGAIHI